MKYVKKYEGFFDKIVNPIKGAISKIDDKIKKRKVISDLVNDLNKQKINLSLEVTNDYALIELNGKHINYINSDRVFKLLIDDVDYTEYDNDDILVKALNNLYQRNRQMLGRLERALKFKDDGNFETHRIELKYRLEEFNVIKDPYADQPFDLISMNSLFDFYGVEYNDDIVYKYLLRKNTK